MNLNCAILHADETIISMMKEYIAKVPFLALCGAYGNPLEALRGYYETKVEVYFVSLAAIGESGINGMDFCKMLSLPTRVIFLAEDGRYAAECFRLDALDYLVGKFDFFVFLQAVSKADRWFALQSAEATGNNVHANVRPAAALSPQKFYIKVDGRIVRLKLKEIVYVEALGDYVKIYCNDGGKPMISQCSMKCMEEKLPSSEFIRVHRSFIVRKNSIDTIDRNAMVVGNKEIPIGNAYRDQIKRYVSCLSVL